MMQFAWVWLFFGGGVLGLAVVLAVADRRRRIRLVRDAADTMLRYRQQLEDADALHARQLALLDRQEEVLRRAERLLDRWEEQAGIRAGSDAVTNRPRD